MGHSSVDLPGVQGSLRQGPPGHGNYKIKAKRDIITEAGFIKAGQVGFVSASWVQALKKNKSCSCKGSLNWFTWQ